MIDVLEDTQNWLGDRCTATRTFSCTFLQSPYLPKTKNSRNMRIGLDQKTSFTNRVCGIFSPGRRPRDYYIFGGEGEVFAPPPCLKGEREAPPPCLKGGTNGPETVTMVKILRSCDFCKKKGKNMFHKTILVNIFISPDFFQPTKIFNPPPTT